MNEYSIAWGPDHITPFISLTDGSISDISAATPFLHQGEPRELGKWGQEGDVVRMTSCSRSGLSGTGFIKVPLNMVPVGYYRTDRSSQNFYGPDYGLEEFKDDRFGQYYQGAGRWHILVPLKRPSGEKWEHDNRFPTVFVAVGVGELLVFSGYGIPDSFTKEIQVPWYSCNGNGTVVRRELRVKYSLPGRVSARRPSLFQVVDLEEPRKAATETSNEIHWMPDAFFRRGPFSHYLPEDATGKFPHYRWEQALGISANISRDPLKRRHLCLDKYVVYSDLQEFTWGIGEQLNGWAHFAPRCFYKRTGLDEFKVVIVGEDEEWEYEKNFTAMSFHRVLSANQLVDTMKAALEDKIQQQRAINARHAYRTPEAIRAQLAQYPDEVLTIQDSLDFGNCLPGTQGFMTEFKLTGKEQISFSHLLEHPRLDEMVKGFPGFANLVIFKFTKLEHAAGVAARAIVDGGPGAPETELVDKPTHEEARIVPPESQEREPTDVDTRW